MSVRFSIKSRMIPPDLEERYGKERMEKLLVLIEEQKNVSEIIQTGLFSRADAANVISDLSRAGVLTMSDKKKPSVEPKPAGKKAPSAKPKPAPSVMLLTDSTADLPKALAREKQIHVIPLTIRLDQNEYKDGVTVSASEFYRMLKASRDFPSTAPPTEEDFHQVFKENIGDRDILGIFISRKMSKTFDRASAAKMNNYNAYVKERARGKKGAANFRIELIDSRLVSMGAGLVLMEVADKISRGASMDEAMDLVNTMIPKMKVLLIVDKLKFLARGGRIGKARATFGTLFRFRPILGMSDGALEDRGKVIGGKRAQNRLVGMIKDDLGDPHVPINMAITHADALTYAERMRELLETNLNCRNITMTDFGPTVGAHTGPGTVGVAYYPAADNR